MKMVEQRTDSSSCSRDSSSGSSSTCVSTAAAAAAAVTAAAAVVAAGVYDRAVTPAPMEKREAHQQRVWHRAARRLAAGGWRLGQKNTTSTCLDPGSMQQTLIADCMGA
eukprot:COSAG01_NODE_956_length_12480_cov_109.564090_9_plen_109_part_00